MNPNSTNQKLVKNFVQVSESQTPQTSRNITNLLPYIFRTETNTRFIESTIDHLMSSGSLENIDYYWGKISGNGHKEGIDFYNKEHSTLRQNYQFAPGIEYSLNEKNNSISYINMLNSMKEKGIDINNLDRLFSEPGYVLDLPINADMFLNYINYYWIPVDLPICNIDASDSDPIDIDDIIHLNNYTTPILANGDTLTFINGMRIKFVGDNITSTSNDFGTDIVYLIAGVGTGNINLIPMSKPGTKTIYSRILPYSPSVPTEWDTIDLLNLSTPEEETGWDADIYDMSIYTNIQKEYVVMSSDSVDQNAWSRCNVWKSIYALEETARYTGINLAMFKNISNIAKRPIIEFSGNISLFNSGTTQKFYIDHYITENIDIFSDIVGNATVIINGLTLVDNDLILVHSSNFIVNRIYKVSNAGSSITLTEIANPSNYDDLDKIVILNSDNNEFIGSELYWYDNKWNKGQQKLNRGSHPLFNIYDRHGVNFSDYNQSTFRGDKIFHYSFDEYTTLDAELGFKAKRNDSAADEFMYSVSIENSDYQYVVVSDNFVSIPGNRYFKNITNGKLKQIWKKLPAMQRVKKSQSIIVDDINQNITFPIATDSGCSAKFVVIRNGDIHSVVMHEKYGIVDDQGKNTNITISRKKENIFKFLSSQQNDVLEFLDPYLNSSAGLIVAQSDNSYTLEISNNYEYDTLILKSASTSTFVRVFLHDRILDGVLVKRNGIRLVESIDYTINNTHITILPPHNINDVYEFEIVDNENSIQYPEVAPVFKFNPKNDILHDELGFSNLFNHFRQMLEWNPLFKGSVSGMNNYHAMCNGIVLNGTIRQQIYTPIISSLLFNDLHLNIIDTIETAANDYSRFKLFFKNKVKQLWETSSFTSVRELVDTALSEIHIGKTSEFKYAHSDMAYYSFANESTYDIVDNNPIQLDTAIHSRGKTDIHCNIWLYDELSGKPEWRPLSFNEYILDFNQLSLTITPVINILPNAKLLVRIYDSEQLSFIPFSLAKLGIVEPHNVQITNLNLIGHDGSIHALKSANIFNMMSVDFDVIGAAIYDLETRIRNNIKSKQSNYDVKFINQWLRHVLMKNIKWQDITALLINDFNIWSNDNNHIISEYVDYDPMNPFTWNYSELYGENSASWKTLYRNIFGTHRPDSHPWEMMGYSEKPIWWDIHYSWETGIKRDNLIFALINGIVTDPSVNTRPNPIYAIDYDWENNEIVDNAGILNNPVDAGLVPDVNYDNRSKSFKFGDLMNTKEIEWMNSSEYGFSLLSALIKLKPISTVDLFWKYDDFNSYISENMETVQIYNSEFEDRRFNRWNNLHEYIPTGGELYRADVVSSTNGFVDSDIIINKPGFDNLAVLLLKTVDGKISSVKIKNPGSGYQHDYILTIPSNTDGFAKISLEFIRNTRKTSPGLNALLIENTTNENASMMISKSIKTSKISAILHMGGFTDKNLIDVWLDGSFKKGKVRIPKENIRLYLNKNPTGISIYYSGIRISKTSSGFIISGYDTKNKYFDIFEYNTAGNKRIVALGNYNITQYTDISNVNRIYYDSIINKRQDLYNFISGLGDYYTHLGFTTTSWREVARNAILWSLDNEATDDFYANGLHEQLEWQFGNRGFLDEISNSNINGRFILDKDFNVIDYSNIVVIRQSNSAKVKLKDISTLAGIEFRLIEYEHLLAIDSVSSFNDYVFDTITGIYQDRINIKGERSKNWHGLPESFGHLLLNDRLINNFDSVSRESTIDTINLDSKAMDISTRKTMGFNFGINDRSYLENTMVSDNASRRFSVGERIYKGTQTALDAFIRNKNILGTESNYSMSEEWMVRLGYYGDSYNKVPIQFELDVFDIKSNPQLVRFNTYPRVDRTDDNIIDISMNDSKYISGEFSNLFNTLPIRKYVNLSLNDAKIFKTHNQIAGMPLVTEVDYMVDSVDNISQVFDLSADYNKLSEWKSNVSYSQGDKVRIYGKAYELMSNSTGLTSIASPIVLRSTTIYPIVPNNSTFSLTLTQDNVDTSFTVQFNKTGISNSFGLIVDRGITVNPSLASGTTMVLDGVPITFSKRGNINEYQPIVYQGTKSDISIIGTVGKRLLIDGITVDFQRTTSSANNILLGTVYANAIQRSASIELSDNDSQNLSSSKISALDMLRTAYMLEEQSISDPTGEISWDRWLNGYTESEVYYEGYYSGLYSGSGMNIEFLTDQIQAATTGSKPYLINLQELLSIDIDIINAVMGTEYTDISLPTDISSQTASARLGARADMNLVTSRIKSGSAISINDVLRTFVTTIAETWQPLEIIARINSAMTVAGKSIVASLGDLNNLVLSATANDSNNRLIISSGSANVELGIPPGGITLDASMNQINGLINLNIIDVVNQINISNIPGVTAIARSVPGGNVLELNSNNRQLVIGVGSANQTLGINAGIRTSAITETVVDTSLQIYDIIEQINDNIRLLNLSSVIFAENINNTILIRSSVDKLTVNNGTANAALGFAPVVINALGRGVSNQFNEDEWLEIEDPLNFSIWVKDNLGKSFSALERMSGYNVYQIFDFEYEIDDICEGIESGDDVQIKLFKTHYLQPGDFVAIVNSNSSPNIDGIHRVTDIRRTTRTNEFGEEFIDSTAFLIDEYVLEKGFGGKLFVLKPIRFSSSLDLFATISNPNLGYMIDGLGWKPGMLAYVDNIIDNNNNPTNIAGVYKCIQDFANGGISFELIRQLEPKLDNARIKNAVLYSGKTHGFISEYEVYDPAKGIIPGIASRELDIISPYDRAAYTNSIDIDKPISNSDYWGESFVGTTWWDLRNAVYLDYEQGSLEYKQKHWGKLYPTSTIDVYEWTKSPVLPSQYSTEVLQQTVIDGVVLTGEPFYDIGEFGEEIYSWVEELKFNVATNSYETYYYFWVKNKTTLPNRDRTLSVLQIADILKSPGENGINWIAACSTDSILVSNLDACTNCVDSIFQINLALDDNADSHHEFVILPDKSNLSVIPNWLKDGLATSLAGIDKNTIRIIYKIWETDLRYNRDSVVKYNNKYFIAKGRNHSIPPLSEFGNIYWKEITSFIEKEVELYWDIKPFGHLWDRDPWDGVSWDKPFPDDIRNIGGYIDIYLPLRVPDPWLHRFNRFGPDILPRQSWIAKLISGQYTAIEKINSILAKLNLVDDVFGWDRVLKSIVTKDSLSFDMSTLWIYIDWVREGFSITRKPNHIINDELELQNVNVSQGRLVFVRSVMDIDGLRRNRIYEYQDDGSWQLVFKQNATIQFIPELWDGKLGAYSWDNFAWDTNQFDLNISEYFIEIIETLEKDILSNLRIELYHEFWMSMIAYMYGEQDIIDWIIKSSYIEMAINSDINTNNKFTIDMTQSLIDYVNKVKPFHTKLRNIYDSRAVIDKTSIVMDEIDNVINSEIRLNNHDMTWLGDLTIIGGDTETTSDSSEFLSTEFDYNYVGGDFNNPALSSYGTEHYSSKLNDFLSIIITRNMTDDEEDEFTKRLCIVTDNKNKRYSFNITEDNTYILDSEISESDTIIELSDNIDIPVVSSALINGYGLAWINNECILFKNVDGNKLLNCVRGFLNSSALPHADGSNVYITEMLSSQLPNNIIIYDNPAIMATDMTV